MQQIDMIFIGIVPTARSTATPLAALDSDLNLIKLESRARDEVVAELAQKPSAVVAICGPQGLNLGLMRDPQFRGSLNPSPRLGAWSNVRVVEYLLYSHGIRLPLTRDRGDDCPTWMRTSFDFFAQLKEFGYKTSPQSDEPRQTLEVNANACFAVLLDRLPFTKSSLEGRLQRQLMLYDRGLNIPDPMRVFEEITRYRLIQGILDLEGLYSPQELDALVAAFTAWQAINRPQNTTRIGNFKEGQILLPVEGLRKVYK